MRQKTTMTDKPVPAPLKLFKGMKKTEQQHSNSQTDPDKERGNIVTVRQTQTRSARSFAPF